MSQKSPMNHLSKFTTERKTLLLFHCLVFIWNGENLVNSWQVKEKCYNVQSNENLAHVLHNSTGSRNSFLCRRMSFLNPHLSFHKRPRLWSHLYHSGKTRQGGFWSMSASCWFGWWGWLGNSTRWVIFPPCLQGLNVFLTLLFQSLLCFSWQVGLCKALLAWASLCEALILDLLED